jgi:ankyrin repeat protein
MKAVREMKVELIESLLTHGSNANAVDDAGQAPLMYLGRNSVLDNLPTGGGGHSGKPQSWDEKSARQIVSMLLAHGANLNLIDKRGMSAMKAAAYAGQSSLVHILLDNGADPNDALVGAVAYGNEELLAALLRKGADVNIPVKREKTLLHYAKSLKRPQIIAILVKAGAQE